MGCSAGHAPDWWRDEQAMLALQGCASAADVDLEQVAPRLGERQACQRGPAACIGIMADALTAMVDGKPALVVPRIRMLDLMVRFGM